MYVIVSPFSKTFDDLGLIYEVPDFLVWDIKTGQIVEIPLKTWSELAITLEIKKEIQVDYNISKIKSISCIFDERIFLNTHQIQIILWITKYYFTPIHNAARLFFPKNLLWKIEKGKLKIASPQPSPLEEREYSIRKWELKSPWYVFNLAQELRKKQTPSEKKLWWFLKNKQFLNLKFRRQHPIWKYIADFYCENLKFIIELDWEIHQHKKQKEYDIARNELLKEYWFNILRISNNLIIKNESQYIYEYINKNIENSLSSKGEARWGFHYTFNHNIKLSQAQEKIYSDIKNSDIPKTLLYWITGSGKTEVYIKLIQDNILAGKQTLVLIPEIILTNQILNRLQKVFWEDVISINSSITEATKTKHWIDIYTWNAKVIIWTRSSLFYPYNNLATIIIDEEHDNSYISDQAPRYNAIEVAEKITELNWNNLILASGTPSVSAMYRASKSPDYQVLNLLEKFS